MPNLRELYLQDNLLTSIANITFATLKQLEVLFLQGNRLADFSVWSLTSLNNPHLVSLRLAGNLWSCDCAYLRRFNQWLETVAAKVADHAQLECHSEDDDDADEDVLKRMNGDVSCEEEPRGGELFDPALDNNNSDDDSLGHNLFASQLLVPIIAAAVALLTLLVVLLVVFLCRHEVRLCLSLNYGVRFFKKVENTGDGDFEKVYDAFVIYSKGDEMFVRDVLASELELGPSRHRLCLYHRDLNASHFVTDSIVQAVETSRRTVLVLSENLLQQGGSSNSYELID